MNINFHIVNAQREQEWPDKEWWEKRLRPECLQSSRVCFVIIFWDYHPFPLSIFLVTNETRSQLFLFFPPVSDYYLLKKTPPSMVWFFLSMKVLGMLTLLSCPICRQVRLSSNSFLFSETYLIYNTMSRLIKLHPYFIFVTGRDQIKKVLRFLVTPISFFFAQSNIPSTSGLIINFVHLSNMYTRFMSRFY